MKREIVSVLNAEDEYLMKNILAAGRIKHKFAVRLLTVLDRAKGRGTNETAAILGIHPVTVSLYVKRYNAGGKSEPGSGCLECQSPFSYRRRCTNRA
ncbi:MAG: hypothetical protein LBP37_02165 [Spirochaetaceae bacterium]|jgi:hypothetical protein|nr:hypothetical protein [Spirochaetaceae bacterium]